MTNLTARRALSALAHPATLAAALLMLCNDFVLRQFAPSWLTGKLSDAAWLVIAPPLLALAISWVIPRRPWLAGAAALAAAGFGFAAVKSIPQIYHLASVLIATLSGGTAGTRFDPTDLLALPAMLIAAWVWSRAAAPRPRSLRWAGLPLVMLALLADSPRPDFGVFCLAQPDDGRLIAFAEIKLEVAQFQSNDGGLSWQPASPNIEKPSRCDVFSQPDLPNLPDPGQPGAQLRAAASGTPRIEQSIDGGMSWQTIIGEGHPPFTIQPTSEAENEYYSGVFQDWFTSGFQVMDQAQDGGTKNIVYAMGTQGILIRTADSGWRWAAVGVYKSNLALTVTASRADMVGPLLGSDLWFLLLVLAPLFLAATSWATFSKDLWRVIPLILAAPIIWLLLNDQPLVKAVYESLALLLALAALPALLVFLVIQAIRALRKNWRQAMAALGMGLSASLLFIVPQLGWVLLDLPASRTVAIVFGNVLSVVAAIEAAIWLHRRQAVENEPPER